MRYPRQQITEPVAVRTFAGEGGRGRVYSAPVSTLADVDAKRQLVRDATGAEVVSETTICVSPATDPGLDLAALFVPESMVSVRGGAESRVITASPVLLRGRVVYYEIAIA